MAIFSCTNLVTIFRGLCEENDLFLEVLFSDQGDCGMCIYVLLVLYSVYIVHNYVCANDHILCLLLFLQSLSCGCYSTVAFLITVHL